MENKQPYKKMKAFIDNGEVGSRSDFYGLILHSYELEDNEKTHYVFVKAISNSENKHDGYTEWLKLFNKLYPFLLSSTERQERIKEFLSEEEIKEIDEIIKQ